MDSQTHSIHFLLGHHVTDYKSATAEEPSNHALLKNMD